MSWISKYAGKAEDLLNRIDNNAASVLSGKEKKKRSSGTIPVDEPLLSVTTSSPQPQTSSFSGTNSPASLTPKRSTESFTPNLREVNELSRDEKLISFLNNPSVGMGDIEVPPPVPQKDLVIVEKVEGLAQTSPKKSPSSPDVSSLKNENDMLRNEVRSLNVEISLLLGRVKLAEGESITSKAALSKKESEINVLKKEIADLTQQMKDVEKNHENGFLENERLKLNYKSRNEHTRELEEKLSDLQLEIHKREEQYKSDLANMRIRMTEVEELLSSSNTDHLKEINESKQRLDEMRNELEDYKARARKSLADKEALILELKSGNPVGPQTESMEITQLRNELENISSELEKCEMRVEIERRRSEEAAARLEAYREESTSEINSIRTRFRQEAERRLAAEENCRLHAEELHKVRDDLTKQLAAMSERFREKVNEVLSLRRQITQRGDSKPNLSEAKVSTLTQALVQKQAALEGMTNERNQLRLEMERIKNAYGQYVNHLNVRSNVNDTDDAKAQVPTFMLESPFDTGVTRKVKRAYSSLDAVSIRTGMFLRRYPLARIFVLCYGICLHLWVCLVLFSNTPDTKI
uniref:Golgin subfamily A member 5 n=1 Tax=Lygus hesperus TaxID=30085 RepID=A0A0A9XYI4_LYGHE